MKLRALLPGAALLLALFSLTTRGAPPPANAAATPSASPKTGEEISALSAAAQDLKIGSSSMPVSGGKATLTIGTLRRDKGVYTGTYKISVNPYFFKNENGRLAITVSDQILAEAAEGKVVTVTGSATASGRGGETRRINVIATPADKDHGSLKLWFMVGERKMIFEPEYHFAETPAAVSASSKPQTRRVKRPVVTSHAGMRDEDSQRP